jgi:hypothetical protein
MVDELRYMREESERWLQTSKRRFLVREVCDSGQRSSISQGDDRGGFARRGVNARSESEAGEMETETRSQRFEGMCHEARAVNQMAEGQKDG